MEEFWLIFYLNFWPICGQFLRIFDWFFIWIFGQFVVNFWRILIDFLFEFLTNFLLIFGLFLRNFPWFFIWIFSQFWSFFSLFLIWILKGFLVIFRSFFYRFSTWICGQFLRNFNWLFIWIFKRFSVILGRFLVDFWSISEEFLLTIWNSLSILVVFWLILFSNFGWFLTIFPLIHHQFSVVFYQNYQHQTPKTSWSPFLTIFQFIFGQFFVSLLTSFR